MSKILTFADLRERPQGLNLRQHCDLIRSTLAARVDRMETIVRGAEEAGRDNLLASEQREFDDHTSEQNKLQLLLRQLENSPEGQKVDYRQIVHTDGPSTRSGWSVGAEAGTYRRDGSGASWVRDAITSTLHGDPDARDRLRRNATEVAQLEGRALSTVDGAGGQLVPPAWLMGEIATYARAARVTADQVRRLPLPPGTDSINIPTITGGTEVAEQATQNTAIAETDATMSSVSASVATLAGGQTLSLQLVEQSPAGADQIILADLLADLAQTVDQFVLTNNAAGKRGILSVAGTNAVTYTDPDPTAPELHPKVADAISQIHTGRFLPPDKIVMHPRRWAWLTAAVDSTGRPLVVPAAQMPSNSAAAQGNVVSEGFVGSMQGLPVYIDPNIPTNLGAGTNEDRIIVLRSSDLLLYEGPIRAEVLREVKATTLGIYLRVYRYAAFTAERYPKSISVISGTGLATPTF